MSHCLTGFTATAIQRLEILGTVLRIEAFRHIATNRFGRSEALIPKPTEITPVVPCLPFNSQRQFIEQLIEDGSLSLNEMKLAVTYHDPCDLGRHGDIYESPRKILHAIPGLTLIELEDNRAKSICCGGGGNLEMSDADLSGRVAQKKIEEIQKTGAKTVITSCQQCVRTIKARARQEKIDLDVIDMTAFVLQ